MPKRSSRKKPQPEPDINQLAAHIVAQSTGQTQPDQRKPEKNPAAVALGRLGGLKGGRARAAKLSDKQKVRIARHAAKVRWRSKSSIKPE
jgi:hypothetical protein